MVGVVGADGGGVADFRVVVVVELALLPEDDVVFVVAEPDFDVVVVDPEDLAVVLVDDDFPVVVVGLAVEPVLPRAVVAVLLAVVEVVLGLVDVDVVPFDPSASAVVVVVAPAFIVVVVVGLAFLGSGTVQVRREEPS